MALWGFGMTKSSTVLKALIVAYRELDRPVDVLDVSEATEGYGWLPPRVVFAELESLRRRGIVKAVSSGPFGYTHYWVELGDLSKKFDVWNRGDPVEIEGEFKNIREALDFLESSDAS